MHAPRPSRYGEKFYRSRRNTIGLVLAVGAALLTYAFLTWPIAVPQGHGNLGPAWGVVALLVALAYLYGAWKADTNWRLARLTLFIAGAFQVALGVVMTLILLPLRDGLFWWSGLYDAIPAILALIAGALLHPPSGERSVPEPVWQDLERRQKVDEQRQRTAGAR
jgi:hypothetical protein